MPILILDAPFIRIGKNKDVCKLLSFIHRGSHVAEIIFRNDIFQHGTAARCHHKTYLVRKRRDNVCIHDTIPIAEMITTSNVEKNNLIVFIISFVYLLCIITSLPNLPIVNLLDKSRNGFLAIIWISQHLYEQKFSTSYIFCMILMTADFTVINVKWT